MRSLEDTPAHDTATPRAPLRRPRAGRARRLPPPRTRASRCRGRAASGRPGPPTRRGSARRRSRAPPTPPRPPPPRRAQRGSPPSPAPGAAPRRGRLRAPPPVRAAGGEGGRVLGIGDLAVPREFHELAAAPGPHSLAERGVEEAREEAERRGLAVLLAHEQKREVGRAEDGRRRHLEGGERDPRP